MSEHRLFSSQKGDGDQTIAFLHGFADTSESWASIVNELSSEARTIAFDLPGHGGSLDCPDVRRTSTVADALLQELAVLGGGPVHLVGHSMGGAVAVLAALKKPDVIASLTLLAPGGLGTEINHRLLQRYAEAEDAGTLRSVLENMYGWNNPVSETTIERLVAMRRRPGQRDKLIEIAAGLSRDGKQGVIPREKLASLEMRVKVLWGTQDRVLPTRQAHRLPPMFAGHIFEDTGHMLPAEIPDAVIALIRQNIR